MLGSKDEVVLLGDRRMSKSAVQEIQEHVESQKGDPDVQPGQPARFTEACGPDDCIAQGDLNIFLMEDFEEVPSGYKLVEHLKERDKQLVPGNLEGARHILDSLKGVKMYRPVTWTEESLEGPILVLSEERTVTHPVHGPVTLLASRTFGFSYQREWAKERQRAVRSLD